MATQADKINTGALATIVIVLAISTLGISAALTALVRYETQVHGEQKGVNANLRTYRDLVNKQRADMSKEATWVDKGQERVSLPVERAMELVIQDLRKDGSLATEGAADAGAATAEGGMIENQVGMKSFDREHAGQPSGQGGVTPAEAVKEGGNTTHKDTDRPNLPQKPAPAAPKPAPAVPPGAPAPAPQPPTPSPSP
jgi:hypothetical protein